MSQIRFHEMYTKIYNDCFPLKKASRKQRHFKKPWLTKALLKSIETKNKLYKKYLQVPTVDNSLLYKGYKNKLNHTLHLAKCRYYEKKLEDAKSNTHAIWKILNEVLNVTLFGKSGLNENCVEPFFIATHLETLKCVGENSQCI